MKKIVIGLGGSVVFSKKFSPEYLKKLKKLFSDLSRDYKLYVIVGGGQPCRDYFSKAKSVSRVGNKELDQLGIQVTRANAKFMTAIFGPKLACQKIIINPCEIPLFSRNIIFGGGWNPGNSTDYVAVKVAEQLKVNQIVVMTNISYIYDKDPGKFKQAEPLKKMTWSELKKLVGSEWKACGHTPFDPRACQAAKKNNLTMKFLNGKNLGNVKKAILDQKFKGTIVE